MAYEAERQLILNHQALVRQVRERVVRYATTQWTGLGSWRDQDIQRFVETVVPVVESGQKQVWTLTNAYFDSIARVMGFPPVPSEAFTGNLRGVESAEVYHRPAVTTYTALAEGKTIEESVKLATYRLTDLVAMDMQLAQTHAANRKMRGSRWVGYRRVLTGRENCALCVLASTQRYHKRDLLPIHPGCDCSVAPISGMADPGQVINEERLEAINAALDRAGVTDTHATWDGKKDRTITDIIVREHGEYGPTLSWREHGFTGPQDI